MFTTDQFLICIDLDGTLLKDDKTISLETKKYLKKLEESGHYICLTSGRPLFNVAKYYNDIGLINSPIIAFNGHEAINISTKQIVSSHSFTYEEILKIYRLLNENKLSTCFLSMDNSYIFIDNFDDFLLTFYTSKETKINQTSSFLNEYNLNSSFNVVFKMNNFSDKEKVRELILKNFNDLDPRFWEDFPYCELYRKGVSKSKTIDEVAFKLNIPSEKIIVFGDAQNDYEMLKDHKNSYVMINGLETLRQVASKISEFSNNEDGVKIELEKLFKI